MVDKIQLSEPLMTSLIVKNTNDDEPRKSEFSKSMYQAIDKIPQAPNFESSDYSIQKFTDDGSIKLLKGSDNFIYQDLKNKTFTLYEVGTNKILAERSFKPLDPENYFFQSIRMFQDNKKLMMNFEKSVSFIDVDQFLKGTSDQKISIDFRTDDFKVIGLNKHNQLTFAIKQKKVTSLITVQIPADVTDSDLQFDQMDTINKQEYQSKNIQKLTFLQYTDNDRFLMFHDLEKQQIHYLDISTGILSMNPFETKVTHKPISQNFQRLVTWTDLSLVILEYEFSQAKIEDDPFNLDLDLDLGLDLDDPFGDDPFADILKKPKPAVKKVEPAKTFTKRIFKIQVPEKIKQLISLVGTCMYYLNTQSVLMIYDISKKQYINQFDMKGRNKVQIAFKNNDIYFYFKDSESDYDSCVKACRTNLIVSSAFNTAYTQTQQVYQQFMHCGYLTGFENTEPKIEGKIIVVSTHNGMKYSIKEPEKYDISQTFYIPKIHSVLLNYTLTDEMTQRISLISMDDETQQVIYEGIDKIQDLIIFDKDNTIFYYPKIKTIIIKEKDGDKEKEIKIEETTIMKLEILSKTSFLLTEIKEFKERINCVQKLGNNILVGYKGGFFKSFYLLDQFGKEIEKATFDYKIGTIFDINLEEKTFSIQNNDFLIQKFNYETKQVTYTSSYVPEDDMLWEIWGDLVIGIESVGSRIIILQRDTLEIRVQLTVNYKLQHETKKITQTQIQHSAKSNSIHEMLIYFFPNSYQKEVLQADIGQATYYLDYIPYSNFFEYNVDTQTIDFYNNHKDKIKITQISLKYNDIDIDFLKNLKNTPDNDMIDFLKKNELNTIMFNPYPFYPSYIHLIALRPRVLEELIKKLQFADKEALPILMGKDRFDKTPLDIAIEKNQAKSITLFMNMMLRFQDSFLMNHVFDKHIIGMLEKGYDVREYFQSKMPIYQIEETCYPDLHVDNKTNIYYCNSNSPIDFLNEKAYQEIIGKDFKNVGSDRPDPDEPEMQQAIDYYLINVPETITNRDLITSLSQTEQMELFDSLTIQTIINYKWNTYTFSFFFRQFLIFLAFVFVFIFDFYYTISSDTSSTDIMSICLKVTGISILSYFVWYEIQSAMRQGLKDYLADYWNYYDFLLVAVYLVNAFVEIFNYSDILRNIMLCLILLLAFIKLNFFLRIFDGFSFMVSMMQGVFLDLRYFMAFFMITLIEFGMLFTILVSNSSTYETIGSVGYFIMAFRTSLGDFELDTYGDADEQGLSMIILRWVFWIVGVLVMNVVFMNFIIAVISESYEKVMQKVTAQSYKVKVDMIVERELFFNEDDFKNTSLFPKYLILRKPVEGEEEIGQEWQGFVKDLKLHVSKNVMRSKIEMQNTMSLIQKDVKSIQANIAENQTKMAKMEKDSKQEIATLNETIQKKFEEQDEKLSKLIEHLIKKEEDPKDEKNDDLDI